MKKIFNRLLAAIMVVLMILICAPLGGFGGMNMSDLDFGMVVSAGTIPASGSCGDNVTYTYDSTTKELVISGTGAMKDYSGYDSSVFFNSDIESVIINSGVTAIGDYAFSYCDSLTSITIPDSVSTISHSAFVACHGLAGITVDKDNNYFSTDEYGVLFDKNKTVLIQYPLGISIAEYTIPCSVTNIGYEAFFSCSTLTSVIIPDSVTNIGYEAFSYCYNLTNVILPHSVTTIERDAFYGCANLISVTIPDSVTTIGSGAFAACPKLTRITVDKDNNYFSTDEYGVLFDKNKTVLIQYPVGISRAEYVIPDSVTDIGNAAFSYCDSLTSITIPDSVTNIGYGAFENCGSLTSVIIPDSVTDIGRAAFLGCDSITSITIPNGITTIGVQTFDYCDSLTSIIIPNSVTTIEWRAFENCGSLTDVYYTGTETQWNIITIDNGNEHLTNAIIHYNFCIHSFKEYTVVKQATCTESGEKTATCSNCSSTDSLIIPATGHKYNEVVTAPTCEEKGYTTFTCECGDSYISDYKSATGHNYDLGVVTTKPTCTKAGVETFTCANCGNTYMEEVAMLGHSYTSEIIATATHLIEGVMMYTCSCGDIYTETIEKIPEHTYISFVETEPGCKTKGTKIFQCECGYFYTESIPATGHKDNDDNNVCDNCGVGVCDHMCHKSGFIGFIWKIINFFGKLFGSNPVCECGMAHY